MEVAIGRIREATRGTAFEGRVYLVGGALRDRVLGTPPGREIDLVVEGDGIALAELLAARGLASHRPVTYPRFGTAMLTIADVAVELVSARAESYDARSRKPDVRPASLRDDVFRRDFTINTLVESLHTGVMQDLTGCAISDLRDRIIRTPLDPAITFHDDPLRMLRAVRFAARFGFAIQDGTRASIAREASRLNLMGSGPPVVSAERIRDEFVKTIGGPDPVRGLELLLDLGLLACFAPELVGCVGVTQNAWHSHDVWRHTLEAMRALMPDTAMPVRLAVLLHDIGKPATRTEDARGIHFYEHQFVGAEMAEQILRRLKFGNDEIRHVAELVRMHMRLGEARPEWSEPAMKRLIRDTGELRGDLFEVARCDIGAMRADVPAADLGALRTRIDDVEARTHASRIESPLDGREIMAALGIVQGRAIGQAKAFLLDEVIEGRLDAADRDACVDALRRWAAAGGPGDCGPAASGAERSSA